MAVRVPLPRYADLPKVVLFHRAHPTDPTVILQLPNEDRTDSETYRLDLEREGDRGWIEGLPGGRDVLYKLTMEMHIAYEPATGGMRAIADLDEPTMRQQEIALARLEASRTANGAQRSTLRSRRHVPPPSTFRLGLMLGQEPLRRAPL
jgi:hypothetical protein